VVGVCCETVVAQAYGTWKALLVVGQGRGGVGIVQLQFQEIVVGLKEKQVPYMSCKFVIALL